MLGKGRTSSGGEEVSEELNLGHGELTLGHSELTLGHGELTLGHVELTLGHGELTLGQPDDQTMLLAKEKNFKEVADV